MAYIKTNWEDAPSTATPLNAENLNKIEEGIYSNSVAAESNAAAIADANLELKIVSHNVTSINENVNDINTLLATKASKATTLAGYGITDAYTTAQTDKYIRNKLDKMPFDSVPELNSPNYVTSGTVYNAILGKVDKANVYTKDEVETLLDEYDELVAGRINSKADKDDLNNVVKTVSTKADKSSFEQGSGNLSCIDDVAKSVIKSSSFNYVKNNNAVTITFSIVFNAGTIPQSGFVRFSGLPFKTLNAQQLLSKVVDNKNKEYYCKLYGTWIAFTAIGGASVVADESLVFSATYII